MSTEKEKYIKHFIDEVTAVYNDIYIGFEYNSEDDEFDIWHDNSKYQFENKGFLAFVGKLMKDILYNNGVFNVSFGYDFVRTESHKSSYSAFFNEYTSIKFIEPSVRVKSDSSIFKYNLNLDLCQQVIEPSLKFVNSHITSFNSEMFCQQYIKNNLTKCMVEENIPNEEKELAA